jgi:hypothetical protein
LRETPCYHSKHVLKTDPPPREAIISHSPWRGHRALVDIHHTLKWITQQPSS